MLVENNNFKILKRKIKHKIKKEPTGRERK